MAAANASTGEALTVSAETIFQSARAGGLQIDGAVAITINNDGASVVHINVSGHHDPGEYMPIPIGSSVTIRVNNNATRPIMQLDTITAKSASGAGQISWGVVERV